MKNESNLIFELSAENRVAYSIPELDVETPELGDIIPSKFLRNEDANLPQVSEVDVVRHYTKLSKKNFGLDDGLYPLGSCTMKYNPKINENIVRYCGFNLVHPLQDEKTVQGCLEVMYNLEKSLCELTGMKEFTSPCV